ncbi:MAG: hypothetical protein EBS73_13550 [Betaproteobacteria bacterium]|nr:hypothetical protein [Betaproteobacteria bacterium]NDE53376.1 hypothetical protein [Actinomycetota bacterium]NBQ79668.1 hypothetical protein [Betaproteobacteria bacterium]NBS40272.1 hypothetical protein [Betaproteobacteria bacterium]NBT82490.1 hypothetical protein [Betaproteobacteria bacterium]
MDFAALAHNMSAPPKSVIKYEGLSGLVKRNLPGGTGVTSVGYKNSYPVGTPMRFSIPQSLLRASPEELLVALEGDGRHGDSESTLDELTRRIAKHARAIPLPEGCAVIPTQAAFPSPLPGLLDALVVITQSTNSVWLKSKSPLLSRLHTTQSVSLLIPDRYANALLRSKP